MEICTKIMTRLKIYTYSGSYKMKKHGSHYTKEEPLRCNHRPTSTGNFNPEPEMQELIAETAIESMLNSFLRCGVVFFCSTQIPTQAGHWRNINLSIFHLLGLESTGCVLTLQRMMNKAKLLNHTNLLNSYKNGENYTINAKSFPNIGDT